MPVATPLEPFFVDANIPTYARGREHPLKEACLRALTRIAEESLPACTSAEVFQEILHRYIAIGRPQVGRQLLEYLDSLIPNVLPVTREDALDAASLSSDYPGLPARDLLHLAVMLHHGVPAILSTDTHFDSLALVRRIDPTDF